MAQKTAVEWLNEMLRDNHKEVFDGNIWEQALEMEKKQIIEALRTSEVELLSWGISAEQYYNKTFKSDQNETETN